MLNQNRLEPIDYLVIGHLTCDLTPDGPQLGGTAAYAALTANALGLRVGIITAVGEDVSLTRLDNIPIVGHRSEKSTTFENIETSNGRVQIIHHTAPLLVPHLIPTTWRSTPIVHFGPVAQEIDLSALRLFQDSLIGLTPQGWLRSWDNHGHIYPSEWPEATFVLQKAGAVVFSMEDVGKNESRIEEMAYACKILVVTDGPNGAYLYVRGNITHIEAPVMNEVDPVGAGDIFATSFFHRLHSTQDPLDAAHFATTIASRSVTRIGLNGVPTEEEIYNSLIELNAHGTHLYTR